MKHIYFFLITFLISSLGFGQTTVSYDFSAVGAVSGLNASPPIAIDGNIGFASFKNGGTANPALNSGQLRLYQNATKGGSIVITPSNGVTITKVIINASGTTGPAGYTVDGGSQTNLSASNTYTIDGISGITEVEFFQRDGSSANRIYVDSFDVTYELASSNDSESDIIESGFDEPDNIDYTMYNATSGLLDSNAIKIGEFIIRDGGATPGDADAVATILTDLELTVTGSANIAALALFDGPANVSEVTSVSGTTTFNNINAGSGLTALDDSDLTFGVYATFKSTVTDNDQIQLTISSATADGVNGSTFSSSDASGASTSIVLDDNKIEVTATDLIFNTDPSDVGLNSVMSPSPSVLAVDSNINTDLDFTDVVTLSSTGTLDGSATSTSSAVSGEASFNNLVFSASGTGFTLTASSGVLNPDTSIGFDVLTLPTEFWSEPFNDNTQYSVTIGGEGNDGPNDYFQLTDGLNINESYSGINGSFFACQDIDDGGWTGSASPSQLTWSGIDINGFSNLNFKGSFASNGGGIDAADFVLIEYQIDSGGWQNLMAFENDGTTSNTFFLEDTDFSGTGDGTALSTTFSDFEKSIGSTGIVLDLRITVSLNSGGEEIAFDDFGLTGNYNGLVYSDGSWNPSAPNATTGSSGALILNGTFNIASDASLNDVIVKPNANITVDPTITLTVNNLTLESTSTKFASLIVDGSISGTVNYKRYTSISGTNDLISPPVTSASQNFGTFAGANTNLEASTATPTLKAFAIFDNTVNTVDDPNGKYINYDTSLNSGTAITFGVGYRAATVDGSALTFTGDVNNGTVNAPIAVGAGSQWNLIGNPYPSYLNAQDFLNNATNTGLLDETNVGIYGYNADTSVWTIFNLLTTDANTAITPGQGFFVAAESNGSVQFTSGMRRVGTTDDFIAGRNSNPANHIMAMLNLIKNSNSYNTDIYFVNNLTRGLDPGYDAGAYGGSSNGLFTNLVENNMGVEMAIQALPANDFNNVVVPLGVKAVQGEQISIGLDTVSTLPANINVYLEDNASNTWTLLNDGDYTFTPSVELNDVGRFFVHFSSTTLSVEDSSLNGLQIFSPQSSKTIVVKGLLHAATTVKVYDIQGREVMNQLIDGTSTTNTISATSLTTGMYIVKLNNQIQERTQKIMIN